MAEHNYERIAAHFREQIATGVLSPGDRLPSSIKMADQFNVSRATTRKALDLLKADGLVTSTVGSGTVVARSTPGFSGNIGTYTTVRQMAATFGAEATTTYTYAGYSDAPADVAEALNLTPGDEVIQRSRTRTQAGHPVTMSTSWHPAQQAHDLPRLLVAENIDGGLDAIEKATGKTIGHLTERVAAALATNEQAEFFNLDQPSAVLIKEHLWLDTNGDPFCYGQGIHPPGEWTEYQVTTDG